MVRLRLLAERAGGGLPAGYYDVVRGNTQVTPNTDNAVPTMPTMVVMLSGLGVT